jgi:selenium metabolism protein YedF
MHILDCRAKSCPIPVLETKRLLEEKTPHELQVAVDNEVSRENVRRFLESRGYQVRAEERDGAIFLSGVKQKQTEATQAGQEKKVVVFIDAETVGRGDDKLGRILMKSFIITIKELKPLPWRIIFINGGVKLASEGSEALPHVQELENLGIELLSCGTCLDFFNLKEKLGAGRVSNMFEIISSLTDATHVVKP